MMHRSYTVPDIQSRALFDRAGQVELGIGGGGGERIALRQ
jgi:hypothetical protein